MRVNLEGEPLDSGINEIEVEENTILCRGISPNTVYVDLEDMELDIHQVNLLIKGLELAKKVFNLEGE